MSRCQCLPSYSHTPSTPTCPDSCLQAGGVIYPIEAALGCADAVIIDLATLTHAGDCTCGVTYSAVPTVVGGAALTAAIVGTELTITNNIADGAALGQYEVVFTMSCDCDIRSVSASIFISISETCLI